MKAWLLYALITWLTYVAVVIMFPAPALARVMLWVGLVATFGQKLTPSEG
jgi:hypothetical protein